PAARACWPLLTQTTHQGLRQVRAKMIRAGTMLCEKSERCAVLPGQHHLTTLQGIEYSLTLTAGCFFQNPKTSIRGWLYMSALVTTRKIILCDGNRFGGVQ